MPKPKPQLNLNFPKPSVPASVPAPPGLFPAFDQACTPEIYELPTTRPPLAVLHGLIAHYNSKSDRPAKIRALGLIAVCLCTMKFSFDRRDSRLWKPNHAQ